MPKEPKENKRNQTMALVATALAAAGSAIFLFSQFGVIAAPWAEHPVKIEQHMKTLAQHGKRLDQITDIAEEDRIFKYFQICLAKGGDPDECEKEARREAEDRRRERERDQE